MSLDATAETVIRFPHAQYADFVLHYDHTASHVHKFVLHHHSAYFRAYFDTLPAPSGSNATKRRGATAHLRTYAHHSLHSPARPNHAGEPDTCASG